MLGISATTLALSAVAATTAYSAYNANKAGQDQRSAQRAATAEAKKQAGLADQANNKANARMPDISAFLASNQGASGLSSTMLTGPQGIDQSRLALGRNTLLGG